MSTKYIDSLDVCRLLTLACKSAGGQKYWAESHGLTPSYVSNVLHSRCEPGKAILDALGLVRVTMYRQRTESASAPVLSGSEANEENVG